jgi:3-deoxy-D-manno-octulosonic-acid transferase
MTTDELFLYVILVFCVLLFVLRYLKSQAIMNEAIKHVVAKHVHEIKTEMHGDMFYWFDNASDQFFAQGKTMEDCVAQLKQVYPGHVFLYTNVANKQYLLVGPDFEPIVVDEGTTLAKKDFE